MSCSLLGYNKCINFNLSGIKELYLVERSWFLRLSRSGGLVTSINSPFSELTTPWKKFIPSSGTFTQSWNRNSLVNYTANVNGTLAYNSWSELSVLESYRFKELVMIIIDYNNNGWFLGENVPVRLTNWSATTNERGQGGGLVSWSFVYNSWTAIPQLDPLLVDEIEGEESACDLWLGEDFYTVPLDVISQCPLDQWTSGPL